MILEQLLQQVSESVGPGLGSPELHASATRITSDFDSLGTAEVTSSQQAVDVMMGVFSLVGPEFLDRLSDLQFEAEKWPLWRVEAEPAACRGEA